MVDFSITLKALATRFAEKERPVGIVLDEEIFRVNCARYEINASEMVDVKTPQATFSEKVTSVGLLTYQGGLSGSNGSGGPGAQIQGGIENIGGEIISNGIGVESHHHEEHDGPSTGKAKQ